MKTARQQISEIDRKLDAIYKQMLKLEKIDRGSSASWKEAWDKHPDLQKAELALFHKRGELQLIVGAAEQKIWARAEVARKIKESKEARKTTSVFQYLHDCKRSAELLGFAELAQHYARAIGVMYPVSQ